MPPSWNLFSITEDKSCDCVCFRAFHFSPGVMPWITLARNHILIGEILLCWSDWKFDEEIKRWTLPLKNIDESVWRVQFNGKNLSLSQVERILQETLITGWKTCFDMLDRYRTDGRRSNNVVLKKKEKSVKQNECLLKYTFSVSAWECLVVG